MKGGQIIRTRMVKNNGHAHALPQRIIDELSKFDKPVPGKNLSDRLRVDIERLQVTISLINHRKKSNVKILSVGKYGNTAYKIVDKKALNTDVKDNYDKRHKRANEMKKIYISYNDKWQVIDGYFILIEQTSNYVKIKSSNNIITIPYHNINKMKEKIENVEVNMLGDKNGKI